MVFILSGEHYAIALSQVKEVIRLSKITPLPEVPRYFRGMINLRGRIISALDLSMKLSLQTNPQIQKPKRQTVIITEVDGLLIGNIVDDVQEVLGLHDDQIERQLNITSQVSREYIIGVAKVENKPLIIVIDMAKVLNTAELNQIQRQEQAQKVA